jgi:Na+/alanine symporter
MSQDPLFILILVVCFAVVVILAMGLGNFAKGSNEGAKKSNKMMQYRIIAQGVAVALIVLFVVLRGAWGN